MCYENQRASEIPSFLVENYLLSLLLRGASLQLLSFGCWWVRVFVSLIHKLTAHKSTVRVHVWRFWHDGDAKITRFSIGYKFVYAACTVSCVQFHRKLFLNCSVHIIFDQFCQFRLTKCGIYVFIVFGLTFVFGGEFRAKNGSPGINVAYENCMWIRFTGYHHRTLIKHTKPMNEFVCECEWMCTCASVVHNNPRYALPHHAGTSLPLRCRRYYCFSFASLNVYSFSLFLSLQLSFFRSVLLTFSIVRLEYMYTFLSEFVSASNKAFAEMNICFGFDFGFTNAFPVMSVIRTSTRHTRILVHTKRDRSLL